MYQTLNLKYFMPQDGNWEAELPMQSEGCLSRWWLFLQNKPNNSRLVCTSQKWKCLPDCFDLGKKIQVCILCQSTCLLKCSAEAINSSFRKKKKKHKKNKQKMKPPPPQKKSQTKVSLNLSHYVSVGLIKGPVRGKIFLKQSYPFLKLIFIVWFWISGIMPLWQPCWQFCASQLLSPDTFTAVLWISEGGVL